MLVGYAQASEAEGTAALDRQVAALVAAGVDPERVWQDMASGKAGERPALEAYLSALQAGDTLVVCKLDRLGRNLAHLADVTRRLEERGAALRTLAGQGARIGTGAEGGRLIAGAIVALAEFERDLLRERERAGLAAARARGRGRKHGGRWRMSAAKIAIAQRALARPETNMRRLCRELGVPPQTLYRHVGLGGELRETGRRFLEERARRRA
jgi:DNA invertase Pin-like site-specific DNA recombinase